MTRSDTQKQPRTIGMELAREYFAQRGNHAEVHLREATLAALLTLAAMRARGAQRSDEQPAQD